MMPPGRDSRRRIELHFSQEEKKTRAFGARWRLRQAQPDLGAIFVRVDFTRLEPLDAEVAVGGFAGAVVVVLVVGLGRIERAGL